MWPMLQKSGLWSLIFGFSLLIGYTFAPFLSFISTIELLIEITLNKQTRPFNSFLVTRKAKLHKRAHHEIPAFYQSLVIWGGIKWPLIVIPYVVSHRNGYICFHAIVSTESQIVTHLSYPLTASICTQLTHVCCTAACWHALLYPWMKRNFIHKLQHIACWTQNKNPTH